MFHPRFKKFLSYYRPYLGLFLAVMACAVLVAVIALVLPLLVRYVTKTVLAGDLAAAPAEIYRTGALMVLLIAAQTACTYIFDYHGHALGARMESDLRAELFAHFQKLSFRFYDEQRTGQLMSRITHDLFSLAELYHHGPEDYLIYSVRFVGAFVILAQIDLRLTLAVFLFLPALGIFTWFMGRRVHDALKTSRERVGEINAAVEDNLAGIRVVKSFANEALEQEKFAAENRRFLDSRKHAYRQEAYLSEGVILLTQLLTAAVVVVGGLSIVRATLDLADLLTFLLYTGYLVEPLIKLTHLTSQFQEGITGFERFMEIIELEPEIQDRPGAVSLDRVRGEVEFRAVSFRYHDRQPHVLRGLSLKVRAGEMVALVGTSGVGKTTLCALIPRFYEVSAGAVLLDGLDVRDIAIETLRRSVGVVQQDVYLFAGTVLENIRYGRPGASLEEVIAAAKSANAHDFITRLPDGYDTDIGQRGVRLSGGQKQRLSIARVFLKDPPVLIFDEATSALDNESERIVQESLAALARGRTTFVIAHRLSTIRQAPRILVLTDQGIAEEGTHAELLARAGPYARLYNTQFEMEMGPG